MLNYSDVNDLKSILTNEIDPTDESVRLAAIASTSTATPDAEIVAASETSANATHLQSAIETVDTTMKLIKIFCLWC